jgi:lysozyme family protein
MSFNLDAEIDALIEREGGDKYTNDPNDSGGPTRWGITQFVARANGYTGDMKDLPRAEAVRIYRRRYWAAPRFDEIANLSAPIAAELFDTGVNMGVAWAGKFLQTALNAFNKRATLWPDLTVDGNIGAQTIEALRRYLAARPMDGETVMVRALNVLQGARYFEIAAGDQKNESFIYGWLANRVT